MEKQTHKILLPLPVSLWERCKAEADADRRPVTVWLQLIIEQYINGRVEK